jgi:hypothetical protein
MKFYDAYVVRGAVPDRPVQFAPGVMLMKAEDVPNLPFAAALFNLPVPGPETVQMIIRDSNPRGALVIEFESQIAPASPGYPREHSTDAITTDERAEIALRVRRSLVLSARASFNMPAHVTFREGGKPEDISVFTIDVPTWGPPPEPDFNVALARFKQIAKFADPNRIGLVIDRIASSRVWPFDRINPAIDLGIAMETALLAGDNKGGEISNKIRFRAGWLIGSDPTTRAEAGKTAALLYDARSGAVHEGKISDKVLKAGFDIEKMDTFVSQIALALLDRGRFPDWNTMLMGG